MYIHIFQLLPSLSFLQTDFPKVWRPKTTTVKKPASHLLVDLPNGPAWACQGGYVTLRHGAKQKCPQSSSHDGRCQWSLANPRSQQAWGKKICTKHFVYKKIYQTCGCFCSCKYVYIYTYTYIYTYIYIHMYTWI